VVATDAGRDSGGGTRESKDRFMALGHVGTITLERKMDCLITRGRFLRTIARPLFSGGLFILFNNIESDPFRKGILRYKMKLIYFAKNTNFFRIFSQNNIFRN